MSLRNLAALCVFSLALVACTAESASPVGTWNLDTTETSAQLDAMMKEQMKDVPDDQRAMMESMLKPMVEGMKEAKMQMEIRADNTFVVDSTMPGDQKEHVEGTWTLSGQTITLTGKSDRTGSEDTMTGTWSGDQITIDEELPNGPKMTMVFRRS